MFDGTTSTHDYGTIIVTHECNKKCAFCIDKYRGKSEFISPCILRKHLAKAKENALKDILIVGGEPTLHPKIVEICKEVKSYGFNLILTTNYTKPEVVKKLDGIVDSFNISFYNQRELPSQKDFVSDLTLATLIHKKQLNTKEKLDNHIEKYSNRMTLKFSTLSVCNDWTNENQTVEYLDGLDADAMVLFDEIEGLKYKGCIIKRNDRLINTNSHQSMKFHINGEVSRTWERI